MNPAPAPCPECARLRAIIAKALALIRRSAGGCVARVRELLEGA